MNDSTLSMTPIPTTPQTVLSTSTATGMVVTFPYTELQASKIATQQELEGAVYAHIRALRALKRDTVSVAEIANALKLTVQQVQSTLQALSAKGVKIA